jgi:hypothetical protein
MDCQAGLTFGATADYRNGALEPLGSTVNANPPPVADLFTPEALLDSVKAGRVRLDTTQAAACIAGWKAAGCDGVVSADVLHACAAMYVGAVQKGGACVVDQACVLGDECDVVSPYNPFDAGADPCAATCQPLPAGLCIEHSNCAQDELCFGTCKPVIPPGAQGQPCGTLIGCNAGLQCQGVLCWDESSVETCVAAPAAGSSCNPPPACGDAGVSLAFGYCSREQFCIEGPGDAGATCATYVPLGGSCQTDSQCDDGYCSGGICTALPTSGPCLDGEWCAQGAFCTTPPDGGPAVCVALLPKGAVCDGFEQCAAPNECVGQPDGSGLCGPVAACDSMPTLSSLTEARRHDLMRFEARYLVTTEF